MTSSRITNAVEGSEGDFNIDDFVNPGFYLRDPSPEPATHSPPQQQPHDPKMISTVNTGMVTGTSPHDPTPHNPHFSTQSPPQEHQHTANTDNTVSVSQSGTPHDAHVSFANLEIFRDQKKRF